MLQLLQPMQGFKAKSAGLLLLADYEPTDLNVSGIPRSIQRNTLRTTKTLSKMEINDAAITVLKALSSTRPDNRATCTTTKDNPRSASTTRPQLRLSGAGIGRTTAFCGTKVPRLSVPILRQVPCLLQKNCDRPKSLPALMRPNALDWRILSPMCGLSRENGSFGRAHQLCSMCCWKAVCG